MTATDVTGFDAIFSTGFFAAFSRFWGARLTKLHREPGEKAKNPVESSSGDGAPKLQISVPCRGRTRPDWSPHCAEFALFGRIWGHFLSRCPFAQRHTN